MGSRRRAQPTSGSPELSIEMSKTTHRSQYHKRCQHDCEDDCDLLQYPELKHKSKSEIQTHKSREAILVETFLQTLNMKTVEEGNDHKPNLLANLLLIDDLIQIIKNLKDGYQNFIIKQIEQTLYRKSDKISGDLIEDTKILMQFYNEKNLKL